MLVYEGMIAEAAKLAGMEVPPDDQLDTDWDREKYPHFHVYCSVQLGRPLTAWNEHWENAEIVASVGPDKIRKITLQELIGLGLRYAS